MAISYKLFVDLFSCEFALLNLFYSTFFILKTTCDFECTVQCTINENCKEDEACINDICRPPCDVHNPCVVNAVCKNENHGSVCSCREGYAGNGLVSCVTGKLFIILKYHLIYKSNLFVNSVIDPQSVCQFNYDCPPNKFCDRFNRICINPCSEDMCGDNAVCIVENHEPQCKCIENYRGNAFISCSRSEICRRDDDCISSQACIDGQCSSPICNCGANSECSITNHKAECVCPKGFSGDPYIACTQSLNPCSPSPCGKNALCEVDSGHPICYCPKNMTGNPFQNCVLDGKECQRNTCGPNSGCRIVNRKTVCFCLVNYEGNPPRKPCSLAKHPCDSSFCGPNTLCSIENNVAKCTCLPNYIESPNTVRGCVERKDPCESNSCGIGAICDSSNPQICVCPENARGNPFKECVTATRTSCKPGPCGKNAECYVTNQDEERCVCSKGFIGDPYEQNGCSEKPQLPCDPNPCGQNAQCRSLNGKTVCLCLEGFEGDPSSREGCYKLDPCQGVCGLNTQCRVENDRPGNKVEIFFKCILI